ncbi:MAG: MarC family transcriptional regulator [Gammaproteobacteria bacterium]|nr:MAG: MarC family transcriptional regulator [Gammaproteobacteria bacterium]
MNEFLSTLLIFLLIMNPLDLVPIFLSLTAGTPSNYKKKMAIKGPIIAWSILLFFGFLGDSILSGLGISLAAFRVGGGILLGITGIRMVLEHRQKTNRAKAEALNAHDDLEDIAVFPLATLFLAGPGSMTAMIIAMNASGGDWLTQLLTVAAMTLVLVAVMVSFILSGKIAHRIPEDFTSAITRVLGILLIALAVQLVFDGTKIAFSL